MSGLLAVAPEAGDWNPVWIVIGAVSLIVFVIVVKLAVLWGKAETGFHRRLVDRRVASLRRKANGRSQ
jgi:hypothetical protein